MRRPICAGIQSTALLLSAVTLSAQVGSMRVTVPSPTAASLGKFGDIPVSLYTGVPNITIPLFTAKGTTLEVPIVLSYHAGGIRVEEIGSWVGIGWTLEAGGTITRTVRGIVDEYPSGYYNTGNTWYSTENWPIPTQTALDNITEEMLDGEPDQFFVSLGGQSGEIVMGPVSTSTSLKEYHVIPHQKWRIEPLVTMDGITGWNITTDDGTLYEFGAAETNTDWSLPTSGQIPKHYGRSYPSSWHLTAITAPSGDVITFGYTGYTVRHSLSTYRERFDFVSYSGPTPCRPDEFGTVNDYQIAGLRLASITTAAHTITFHAGLRSDALSPSGGQQEPRLDSIRVTTPAGVVLRVFKFEQDYSIGRLTLKNVYERDRNGVSLPPYSFTYDPQTLPPLESFAADHWGFYNGKTSNTTAIPRIRHPSGPVLPGADRLPDPAFLRAGVLTKVTYPTGGHNEFVYEINDFGGVGMSAEMPIAEGPLQFTQVSSWEGGGTVQFTVGGTKPTVVTARVEQDPGDCHGQLNPPCPINEIVGVAGWQDSYAVHYISLQPGTYTLRASDAGTYPNGWARIEIEWRDLGPNPKATASGLRVAEVRSADALGNLTIRKYKYTLQSDPTRSSGLVNALPVYSYQFTSAPCSFFSRSTMSKLPLGGGPVVGYREVTVWHGANGEHGKTRHTFRSIMDAHDPGQDEVWPSLRRTDLGWMRGQETSAAEYNSSGQFQQLVESSFAFPPVRRFQAVSVYFLSAGTGGMFGQEFGVWFTNPVEIFSSWVQRVSETTTTYDETGTNAIATSRTFTYGNPAHGQLTQLTETNSDGTERITRMKYPADYTAGSGNAEAIALTAMQGSAHIHNAVIERWVSKRVGGVETVLQGELTTFKTYPTGRYLPYQRFILNSPNPLP